MQKFAAGKFYFEPPSSFTSLDHLVGAGEERFGDGQPERLGGSQVDHELELGRLLDRDVAWLRAAQNLIDILGGAAPQFHIDGSVGYEPSGFDIFALAMHRRQPRAQRQDINAYAIGIHESVTADINCFGATLK